MSSFLKEATSNVRRNPPSEVYMSFAEKSNDFQDIPITGIPTFLVWKCIVQTNACFLDRLSYFQLFDKQIKDSLKVGNTAQLAPPLENYVLASNVRRPSSSVRHLQYVVPSTNNFGNVDWKQNLWWPLRILNWPRKIRVCVFSFWNAHKSHHLHSNFQMSVSNFG